MKLRAPSCMCVYGNSPKSQIRMYHHPTDHNTHPQLPIRILYLQHVPDTIQYHITGLFGPSALPQHHFHTPMAKSTSSSRALVPTPSRPQHAPTSTNMHPKPPIHTYTLL